MPPPRTRTRSLAVVGAGLAGLRAADILLAAGASVTLLDKSRGPGGRCATRRSPAGPFDHGAAAVQPRTPAFRAALARAAACGDLAPAPAAGRLLPPGDPALPAWRGTPGMNAWPQALCARLVARGLRLLTEATVRGLQPGPDGWRLDLAEDAARAALGEARFDTVLLALPAEQAAPLLAPHDPALAAPLAACRSAPCITLMAAWPTDPALPPEPGAPEASSPVAGGPLARLIRQAADAGTPTRRWVAHASTAWSQAHIDSAPETLQAPLLQALQTALQPTLGTQAPAGPPVHLAVHRWRYAQLMQPAAGDCGWSPALRLGSCGDAWQGRTGDAADATVLDGLERAWLSGEALAGRVLAG